MTDLASMKCEACRSDSPKATVAEVREYMKDLPDWMIVRSEGIDRLQRVFAFRNFAEALKFTNAVGAVAEEAKHHPLLTTEWGRVTVQWWTHAIEGMHVNDFILAARTDQLFG